MTPMRPRLSVARLSDGGAGRVRMRQPRATGGGSVSQPSGAVSTGFDTSKPVTLTMWDTENAPGRRRPRTS